MILKLEALTLEDVQQARIWRNQVREVLRTPFLLTEKMQEEFYHGLNRGSDKRYWALKGKSRTVGMAGLVNIEWENRIAEISLIIDPECRGLGLGKQAVKLILHEGFNNMNLKNIYGECYYCNNDIGFWKNLIDYYKASTTILKERKNWNGIHWDSLYFNFSQNQWRCTE